MKSLWSDFVARLDPYVPGEQPGIDRLTKLNTNENPYPPSEKVLDAIGRAVGDLRLYPDPESTRLRSTIADYHGVDRDMVFVGNGSDEVLAHAFNGFFRQSLPILLPDITYSYYPVYCGLYDIRYRTVALDDAFRLDFESYDTRNGGVIFANPNAPTGIAAGRDQIAAFLDRNRSSLVIVDEAYVDFGAESVVPLTRRYENLLVIQTLSKARSLAGLRIGFAVGHERLVEALTRIKNSFNSYPLDRLANAAAIASFEDQAHFERIRQHIIDDRAALNAALYQRGFHCLPSMANFVFARHDDLSGEALARQLRQRNILVRHFDQPRIGDFVRITVGTPQQHHTLVSALDEILTP